MNWKLASPKTRLYICSICILLVGWTISALIYITASGPSDLTMVDEFQNSKIYTHNLELYGGKMNVLTDQFFRWFGGLWHGQSLGVTLASITFVVSLAFTFVAYHLPSGSKSDRPES